MTNKKQLLYLASPYSHADPAVREARFRAAAICAAELMNEGFSVISPICNSHPIAVYGKLDPVDNDFWIEQDTAILTRCDMMLVLKLDEWEQSAGINREINIAMDTGIPITYRADRGYMKAATDSMSGEFQGDEPAVIRIITDVLRERLLTGAHDYGVLDTIHDKRDWFRECGEEIIDAMVYLAAQVFRLNHHLNPCSVPVSARTAAEAYKIQVRPGMEPDKTYCCVCVCGHSQAQAIVINGQWQCAKCGRRHNLKRNQNQKHSGNLHHNTL